MVRLLWSPIRWRPYVSGFWLWPVTKDGAPRSTGRSANYEKTRCDWPPPCRQFSLAITGIGPDSHRSIRTPTSAMPPTTCGWPLGRCPRRRYLPRLSATWWPPSTTDSMLPLSLRELLPALGPTLPAHLWRALGHCLARCMEGHRAVASK